jgi:hypothetical protein
VVFKKPSISFFLKFFGLLLTGIRDHGKNPDLGSGMNILYHISESLKKFLGLKILKFFDADPDPGFKIFLTLDPGSL